jgi:hypothetical protein
MAERVMEGVAPDLAAEGETGLVVEAGVDAGVDPTQSGFGGGVVEVWAAALISDSGFDGFPYAAAAGWV